ncbi:MAG: hypothetical protein R3E01_33765 [Pirellulaceae bacterium]|nr:hypothetical protein [Planctomycetales bacterium]
MTAESVRGNLVIDPLSFANPGGESAGDRWLGRPWGWQQPQADASVVWINTQMGNSIRPPGWLHWNNNQLSPSAANGGDPARDTRYAEFNSTDSSGNPAVTTRRVSWSHPLTAR